MKGLPSTAKFVLVCLADMAGQDNRCWPSYDTIQERTNLSRNAVGKALSRLEEEGYIKKHKRFGSSTVYELMAPASSIQADTISSTESDTTVVRNPVHKPSINHQEEPPLRFKPPTVGEVAEYCMQRNNGVDAQRFVDYYAARGWMIGKNKMKDWKAAVRTWEKRSTPNQPKDDYSDLKAFL